MKTTLFTPFLLILLLGLSSFRNDSPNRPNGWYYVLDSEKDSLSAEPIATVKDFCQLELDSIQENSKDSVTYRIIGQLTESKKAVWAEATEKSIGKHLGFLYNGSLLTAPYVNGKIESGNFLITTNKGYDLKSIYKQLLQESGCKEKYGLIDINSERAPFTSWGIKIGLIAVLLAILCIGLLKMRKIRKNISTRNKH